MKFNSKYSSDSESIGFSFVKVYNRWHRKIKTELATIDITHPQFVVLASLAYLSQHLNEVNQVDIANHSEIDVMTVSTIIKNLEKKQWISRKISTQDTRAKVVFITEQGYTIFNKAIKIVEEIDTIFFSKLGKNEEVLNQLLLSLMEE